MLQSTRFVFLCIVHQIASSTHLCGMVCSQLETLRSAIETCGLTLRMHTAASTRNPLQKLGYTVLTETLLAAALLRHGEVGPALNLYFVTCIHNIYTDTCIYMTFHPNIISSMFVCVCI